VNLFFRPGNSLWKDFLKIFLFTRIQGKCYPDTLEKQKKEQLLLLFINYTYTHIHTLDGEITKREISMPIKL
jgi:hypothetical protein